MMALLTKMGLFEEELAPHAEFIIIEKMVSVFGLINPLVDVALTVVFVVIVVHTMYRKEKTETVKAKKKVKKKSKSRRKYK